jgi:hypothetical protein
LEGELRFWGLREELPVFLLCPGALPYLILLLSISVSNMAFCFYRDIMVKPFLGLGGEEIRKL